MNIILLIIILLIGALVVWRFISERHNIPCPSWLAWMVEMDNPFARETHAATIVQHLDIKQGMSVVDIGCGPGRVTIPLAHQIGVRGTVVAMDIQQEMLDKVRTKAEQQNLQNIEYVHAGIGNNKLQANTYDRALLVMILGEIPTGQRAAAIQEIYSSLKPGGILSVTESIFDPHFQSRTKVRQLIQKFGFKEQANFGSWYAYTLHFAKP